MENSNFLNNLITPNYIYDSSIDYPNRFDKENYIKHFKLVPNLNELFLISNENEMSLIKINFENENYSKTNTREIFAKKESHYIYDSEM